MIFRCVFLSTVFEEETMSWPFAAQEVAHIPWLLAPFFLSKASNSKLSSFHITTAHPLYAPARKGFALKKSCDHTDKYMYFIILSGGFIFEGLPK